MKSAKEIIVHLLATPEFKNVKKRAELLAFEHCLPYSLRRGILFIYIKNNILFFALNHPAFVQEFRLKRPLLLDLLAQYQKQTNKLTSIQEINFFLSHQSKKHDLETKSDYEEFCEGNFDNLACNAAIYEKFEQLRRAILCNK